MSDLLNPDEEKRRIQRFRIEAKDQSAFNKIKIPFLSDRMELIGSTVYSALKYPKAFFDIKIHEAELKELEVQERVLDLEERKVKIVKKFESGKKEIQKNKELEQEFVGEKSDAEKQKNIKTCKEELEYVIQKIRAFGNSVEFHEDEKSVHFNIGIEEEDFGDLTGYSNQLYEDEQISDVDST